MHQECPNLTQTMNYMLQVGGMCFSCLQRCSQFYGVERCQLRPTKGSIYNPTRESNRQPLTHRNQGHWSCLVHSRSLHQTHLVPFQIVISTIAIKQTLIVSDVQCNHRTHHLTRLVNVGSISIHLPKQFFQGLHGLSSEVFKS